jgi:maltose/moltooligosaccharide transporter
MPKEQYSLANSYISLAIGLGSVVAAGTAPFLRWAFDYQMSIPAQFIMGAIAFTLAMTWTCITIKERGKRKEERAGKTKPSTITLAPLGIQAHKAHPSPVPFVNHQLSTFFALSPEVGKICTMQFFTWIGTMCMMIFFTQYAIHTVFMVPDLTNAMQSTKDMFEPAITGGTNFSSICFAVFNLVCFLVAVPIGILSAKFGNKKVHIISVLTMVAAYLGMAFVRGKTTVMALMALSGIGWASICALPFAMLSQYIKKGTEGSVMGIFNIFIAGPQVFVCTLVAWFINKCAFEMGSDAINYHWEYAFLVGALCLVIAAGITSKIKEQI